MSKEDNGTALLLEKRYTLVRDGCPTPLVLHACGLQGKKESLAFFFCQEKVGYQLLLTC